MLLSMDAEADMSVQIIIPTRGTIKAEVMKAVLKLTESGLPVHIEIGSHSACDTKSRAVQWFLERSKADYYLQLDDDVLPPPNFMSLADHGLPIVGAPYPLFNPALLPEPFESVYFRTAGGGHVPINTDGSEVGLVECDAVGGGALCISREVLEKISPAWLDHFDDKGRCIISEDFHFCIEAKKRGYKIFADFNVLCDHYKTFAVRNFSSRIVQASTMWDSIRRAA
jgi:GT2 family glycosyltransferase